MNRASPFVFLACLLAPLAAAAQGIPDCSPARDGAVACIAEKLCRCVYEHGGSMTSRPSGWQWDCGVLRPSCGGALRLDQAPPMPLPPIMLQPRPRGTGPS